ncbi:MAG: hypothetical protein LBR80_01715 [Deltaproteobacteria bacterium]|jgi:hypothetical protein|nr:hypothetical protein [Deltaproteobacteria bacterium]
METTFGLPEGYAKARAVSERLRGVFADACDVKWRHKDEYGRPDISAEELEQIIGMCESAVRWLTGFKLEMCVTAPAEDRRLLTYSLHEEGMRKRLSEVRNGIGSRPGSRSEREWRRILADRALDEACDATTWVSATYCKCRERALARASQKVSASRC